MSRSCASLLEPDCPIPRAHQRLEDAHRLWHQTADSYADPAAFREGLNSTLQALRGGTFALQQQTRGGRDFATWRDAWHNRIRADAVLSWLVQHHRHRVEDDDLASASKARVALRTMPDGPALAEFSVPPLLPAELIPQQLNDSRMGPLVREATVMVLERQWAAGDLPGWELLEALAHCYAALAEPLQEAHAQSCGGQQSPTPEPGTVLPGLPPGQPECMKVSARTKTAVFRLEQGRVLGPAPESLDESDVEQAHAGNDGRGEIDEPDLPPKKDPLRRVAWYFEDARRKLQAEGSYAQRVSIWVPGQEWLSMVLTPADTQDRYLLWSRVAQEVERTRAEAVMTIFEMGARRPGEGQRLVLAAETAGRAHRTFIASFERRGAEVRLGRTRVEEDGRRWYFLDPVRAVWK